MQKGYEKQDEQTSNSQGFCGVRRLDEPQLACKPYFSGSGEFLEAPINVVTDECDPPYWLIAANRVILINVDLLALKDLAERCPWTASPLVTNVGARLSPGLAMVDARVRTRGGFPTPGPSAWYVF